MGQRQEVDVDDFMAKVMENKQRSIDPGVFDQPRRKSRKHKVVSKKIIIFPTLLLLLIGIIFIASNKPQKEEKLQETQSSVLGTFSNKVSFPIYYPDDSKLPTGFSFDLNSITSPKQDAIIYIVEHENSDKLTFSLQPKVTEDELKKFYLNFIPVRYEIPTAIGKAQVGAYNNGPTLQTLISLPADNENTWLIITAPSDINEENLAQILQSLKK